MPPRRRAANAPAAANDALAEINGHRPKTLLKDGETKEATSESSSKKYTMKRTMDHYYCSCPAWRNTGGAVNARTCKHLKSLLGDDYEEARIEQADPPPSGDDELAEIDGRAPKVFMKDGETMEAPSQSSDRKYTIKRTMDHYYCNCPAWRNAGGATNARTCKHLKSILGDKYEDARVERADPGSSTRGKTKAAAGARKRKADTKKDDEDGDEDEDDGTRKSKRTKTPAVKDKDAVFKPLLAEKWDLEKGRDPTGWHMSEKLDGVRAIWDGPKGTFVSREGNKFYAPDWFTKRLPKDVLLDGELWTRAGDFQNCVSIVRAQNNPDKWKFSVTYQIFDCPSLPETEPFEARLSFLQKKFSGRNAIKWARLHPHTTCKSRKHLLEYLEEVIANGGEGIMLREPESCYVNGRSKTLLKVKKFYDADAIVTGHEKGSGRNEDVTGALKCEMLDEDGEPTGKMFKIGTGLNDKQRKNPPKIGTVVIYKFQEVTKDGVPRFPSYGGERAD